MNLFENFTVSLQFLFVKTLLALVQLHLPSLCNPFFINVFRYTLLY